VKAVAMAAQIEKYLINVLISIPPLKTMFGSWKVKWYQQLHTLSICPD
jgi:hypothetical protein